MARVAILNTRGELEQILPSAHTPDFAGKPNVLINPTDEELSALKPAAPPVREVQPHEKLSGKKLYGILKHLKAQGLDLGPDGEDL